MQSFIVMSNSLEKRQEYIQKFCQDNDISQFDLIVIAEEGLPAGRQGSIGIEIVRKLKEPLYLKPFRSKEKALVIENAQNLTTEAQNALLKILEEPPSNTYIILSVDSSEAFLPTVISRCKIIVLDTNKDIGITKEEIAEYSTILGNLKTDSLGEKLAFAEMLSKDKEKTITWLEKAILAERKKMITLRHPELDSGSVLQDVKNLQQTHTLITTTNVNARFALENLFLSYVKRQNS